ncbi:hypothetical protein Nepgr_016384 [Nepenthes gracilis]|uniref:Uncharacterized protein n=1 Tax=Nepenthes gracilis TaxID=150966 RepID=A0AAD3SNF9_NEPGR|nr:hypothetical protein Nepgr_016384 [Nepenthes gracilis]
MLQRLLDSTTLLRDVDGTEVSLLADGPKGKLRDEPKPNPSSSKINKKGPGLGDISSSVPKPTPPPISNSFGALQDFENDGPFDDKERGRDRSKDVLAQVSEKKDGSPLSKQGTVAHTTMVMEPLVDRVNLNGSPASVRDASCWVKGNPISPPDQDALRIVLELI